MGNVLYWISRNTFYVFLRILFRLQIRGKENILKVKGAVYAVNHASYLDPAIAGAAVDTRPMYSLARKSLFANKFFNWWGNRVNVIAFNREVPDSAAMKRIIQLLKRGEIVLLFPEGTRTPDGNLQPPHLGMGLIAVKAGVPIVPAYIKGSYDALSKNSRSIKFAKVRITIGEPIYLDHWLSKTHTERADYEEIANLVMEKIAGLAKLP